MDLKEAIKQRHSVRQYSTEPIKEDAKASLEKTILECFDTLLGHYGKYTGVRNYVAIVAPTAVNQQKFFIDIDKDEAVIKAGFGPLTKLDLGIVRYNFEAASGHRCRTV